MESFASWPIQLIYKNTEITPHLNKLIQQESIYIPHVLPQTKDGRSSDAQLILNTGLLPIHSGATAMLFGTNEYYSLPKALALKGYHSYSFICDEPEFWNQGTTSISYAFNKLYDKYELGRSSKKLNDKELFDATFNYFSKLESPFYAQIVTLSSHHPYQESNCLNKNPDLVKTSSLNKEVGYYLAAIQYADEQIGRFVKKLKQSELYENSIIVITGDHEDITFNQFEGRKEVLLSDRFIPLIILNSPILPIAENNVIGQIDIYPTLLEIMGINDYSFMGLGVSIFARQDDCAVFRTGEIAGNNKKEETIKQKIKSWEISDLIIRSNYFKSKP